MRLNSGQFFMAKDTLGREFLYEFIGIDTDKDAGCSYIQLKNHTEDTITNVEHNWFREREITIPPNEVISCMVEEAKQDFLINHLKYEPKADKDILEFIADVEQHGGIGDSALETIYSLFRAGYCYYFAKMLEDAFPGGTICWAAPFGHIVYLYKEIPYDISGVYSGEAEEFIPISMLGDALYDFRHIPNKTYNASEENLEEIRRKWKQMKGKDEQ